MVMVNGSNERIINFPDQQPIIRNGRTLMPIGSFAGAIGGGSTWNGRDRIATVSYNSRVATIRIGESRMELNVFPWQVTLDVTAEITGDRTMVPLRAVTESLGLEVQWNPQGWNALQTGINLINIIIP
jgi:hypothetical protein